MEQITFGYSIILGILPLLKLVGKQLKYTWQFSTKRDYFFIFISIFDFTMKESVLQLKEI